MSNAIGVYGGSFDPVHVGHLWIAEAALEQLPIDEVRWVPAATSPLKQSGPVASNSQRLAMLQLALSGQGGHVIDTQELDRDGVSYTVMTLEHLRELFPQRRLFLIIGSDSLASFDRWKDPDRILQLGTLAVVARGGMPPPDYSILKDFASPKKIDECVAAEISMPQIEISSRDLRARVLNSRSIRFRVPHAVEAYIHQETLYR
ncbi:nicotinate (nicotinamide) nucleotide adenylyltransferase [Aporhodopirellula aestuarii]|uniref:Probable nicotinate-nucleotide adenylyltransferase n=1 Tax=Aporhodopirellula aestuarii TaxID=2950107 RepID=A0ABT0U3P3_9BACT|nr:nicotinate (nicotinamide) nucleotide adenylyltransferase [Aporhodopirellula aestuarii]MCM2371155.1 nicotinate (nicotinamide) nucleotide adenylyltransferase [Aporhodopirellula aestuarii]